MAVELFRALRTSRLLGHVRPVLPHPLLLVGLVVEILETESEVVDAADCCWDIHIWSLRLFGF